VDNSKHIQLIKYQTIKTLHTMKRRFTILAAAFTLLAFLAIPMGMRGQTRTEVVTYTLDGTITNTGNVNSNYASESDITQDGINWKVTANTTIDPWRFGGKNLDGIDRPMYSTNPIADNVTKVVITNGTATITVNSMTLIVSSNADFSNPTSTIVGEWAASSTTTFERPEGANWTNQYYKLVYNVTNTTGSNKYAQFVAADFYKEMDASAPSINADDVEIAFDATSGAIAYTIDNPAGGTLTANTTSDWLTLGTAGTTTVPFTCIANSTAVARTATVTLTYTYNTDQTVAKNITVTQAANPNSPGSQSNPYTVAQARAAIDAGTGTQGVYATGIVSAIPTAYNSEYGNVTFNMVDEEGDEVFLQAYRCGGEEAVNVTIGDVVVVYGNLTKYGSTYEFGQGCQVVSLEHSANPIITVANATVNVPAAGAEGVLTVTYSNIDAIVANVYFCDAESEAASYDWITAEINDDDNIEYNVSANDGVARTAYLKVRDGNVYSNLVTINQEAYVAPTYAELPFEFDGGRDDIANTDGLYQEGLDSDYGSSPKLKFNTTGDWLLLQFQETPGTLTFDIKGNPSNGVWGGTFKVQTSVDGETYTDLGTYTDLTTTVQSESFNLSEDVRYIKWIYTEKSSGNVALGNIHLYELGGGPVTEYDLTIDPFENLEIFTFVGGDENNPFEGAGTIQVTVGDQVMLSVTAVEGYVIQSLMVDGVEHVNDIADDETYTFTMPDHNVTVSATAVEDVPFEPATYTLVTNTEQLEIGVSSKTYIIVGKKTIDGVDSYYAMGEQRNKNRGGVAISVDGTTATVETAEVHEFIINGTAWIGPDFDFNNEDQGVDYSIYDTNEASQGYLYAASSTENVLKTEAEPDENANWDITIDENGQFSVVARGSNTHNVMQFNYNGGNTLFSCYASASQLPVYLYVKEETSTTVTQTVELVEGWNWFSTYIELEDPIELLEMLEEGLGESGIQIESVVDGVNMNAGDMWVGDLMSIGLMNEHMYMIEVTEAVTFELQGPATNPEAHPITIYPDDWSWIGYPCAEEVDVNVALADFPAEDGDMIESIDDGMIFYDSESGIWVGDFDTMIPGRGYMYLYNGSDEQTLVFRTEGEAKAKAKK
jgi:hypothetical protein